MLKRIAVVVSVVLLAYTDAGAVLPDKDIHAILADRIDVQRQGVAIVVGVIDSSGRRTVAYASTNEGEGPVDANTVFEIGSITKVFTSLLLADAVQRGEVALTDPVSKYLPPNVKVPERGGKKITLVDLATHTSGLPRMPTNFYPKDPGNPYADFSVDQLYEFLSSVELTRDIGYGADHPAKRIEGAPPPAKEHKEIAVDPKTFDGYIGRYQLAPSFVLTVTRRDNHLFVQATAQGEVRSLRRERS